MIEQLIVTYSNGKTAPSFRYYIDAGIDTIEIVEKAKIKSQINDDRTVCMTNLIYSIYKLY